MKDLCARGRSAMNLVLLLALLQLYLLVTGFNPVAVDLVKAMVEDAKDPWSVSVPGVALFRDLGKNPEADLRDLPISAIKSLNEQELQTLADQRRPTETRDFSQATIDSTIKQLHFIYQLKQLKRIVSDSTLPSEATVGRLSDTEEPQLELPLLRQKITARGAFVLFSLANALLLLYLLSLLDSLRVLFTRQVCPPPLLDLILLHPSVIAYCLGAVWLTMPVVGPFIIIYEGRSISIRTAELVMALLTALVMFFLIRLIYKRAQLIRSLWLNATTSPE